MNNKLSHKEVIQLTAEKLKLDPEQVERVMKIFFGRFGLPLLVKHRIEFESVYIGKFFRTIIGHKRKNDEIKEFKKMRAEINKRHIL